jgi:hypothetical protein
LKFKKDTPTATSQPKHVLIYYAACYYILYFASFLPAKVMIQLKDLAKIYMILFMPVPKALHCMKDGPGAGTVVT